MAEFLSQDDINSLLSETMEMTEPEQAEPAAVDPATSNGNGKTRRFFKKPPTPPFRYPQEYRSPVLRPREFSYNPEPTATEEAEGRQIVRSLDNYVAHIKERETLRHK
jgi:hypothetical protein